MIRVLAQFADVDVREYAERISVLASKAILITRFKRSSASSAILK